MKLEARRRSIQSFLSLQTGDAELVGSCMLVLEPFFRMVEDGQYRLSPRAKFPSTTGEILSRATFGLYMNVVYVSAGRPAPIADWMMPEAWRRGAGTAIARSVEPLEFLDLYDASIVAGLSIECEEDADSILNRALWRDRLDELAADRIREVFGIKQKAGRFTNDLRDALFLALGATVLGKREIFVRLKGLLQVLSHGLLLGKHKQFPGSVVLLVA